jgi:hypothetical protein
MVFPRENSNLREDFVRFTKSFTYLTHTDSNSVVNSITINYVMPDKAYCQ